MRACVVLVERNHVPRTALIQPYPTGTPLAFGSPKFEKLLAESLDQRIASRGHFGRGLYFADHAAKAHRYTSKESGDRVMLRAKVLLGNTKTYPKGVNDPNLLREPPGYHSVEGDISGHREVVVYSGDRVLIEYVVRYRVTPKPVSAEDALAIADIESELQQFLANASQQ